MKPINEWDDSIGGYAPCQPIGCDNDFHLPGCVYSLGEAPAAVRSSRPITCICTDFELSKDPWAAANGMCVCGHFESRHTREGLHLVCTDGAPHSLPTPDQAGGA